MRHLTIDIRKQQLQRHRKVKIIAELHPNITNNQQQTSKNEERTAITPINY